MSYESPEERLERLEKSIVSINETMKPLLVALEKLALQNTLIVPAFLMLYQNDLNNSKAIIANSGLLPDEARAALMQQLEKQITEFNSKKAEILASNDLSKLKFPGSLIPPLPPQNPPDKPPGA